MQRHLINDPEGWFDGTICDVNTALFPTTTPSSFTSISQHPTKITCIGLDEEMCLNNKDICKHSNKKKILGGCQYKEEM